MGKESKDSVGINYVVYTPSLLESEMMRNSRSYFRFDLERVDECDLYKNSNKSSLHEQYGEFTILLDKYYKAVSSFSVPTDDLRREPEEDRHTMCGSMDTLLGACFKVAEHLSKTRGGYVEPLIPPMRHPRFCEADRWLFSLEYLVHDFGEICKQLNTNSKTVLFDLGASLEFHKSLKKENPVVWLIDLYARFGIKFDHYYAFEYTVIPPDKVFDSIPNSLLPSYHWYNVPVEAESTSKRNPWTSILSTLDENDFVVVKVDIDTANVEVPLVHQLLNESYAKIIDQFYFEHHVKMKNMERFWGPYPNAIAEGTLQDSLELFTELRKRGIAAHSWV